MRLSQTKQSIDAYVDGLEAAGARLASADLRSIASFLAEFSGEQMSTLVRRGSKVGHTGTAQKSTSENSPCVGAAAQLALLAKVLASGGAKAERTKDVISLSGLLRLFSDSETLVGALEKLRDAMKPEPMEQRINGFIRRLKEHKGTASFDGVFAELGASELKREQVVAIATSVYGNIKKSASRKAALDYIRKPHDAYMSAKRGIDATGGRSAA